MNIKGLFNSLFRNSTKSLVLPSDLVNIPMRDSLDDENIKLLEKYKKKYLEIIQDKKYITSGDITAPDFSKEMLMNFDIFGRLVINRDSNYNLDTMEGYQKRELWIKQNVNPRKIMRYIENMQSIFNETHLRLVALKEIYEEKGFWLARNKRNAILNEINILTNSYAIFKSNVYAALTEVRSYRSELENILNITPREEALGIGKHADFLTYYIGKYIPNYKGTICDINGYNYGKIFDEFAKMERELEIYACSNIDINELNQELNEIDAIEKTVENKKRLIERINDLEDRYQLLNHFGGHELDLMALYEVKFDILTINIVKEESHFELGPSTLVENEAYMYYYDILAKRVETNITGSDSILRQIVGVDDKDTILAIIEMLKVNDHFNYESILFDWFKLAFVLSMESREKIDYFYDNYILDFSKMYDRYIGEWDTTDVIKLYNLDKTGVKVMPNPMSFRTLSNVYALLRNPLRNRYYGVIYKGLFKDYDSLQVIVPDGVTGVLLCSQFTQDQEVFKYTITENQRIFNDIIKLISGKEVIFPSTLKKVMIGGVSINNEVVIPKLVLNEGLEIFNVVNVQKFDNLRIKSITIPSTLNICDIVDTLLLDNFNEKNISKFTDAIEEYTFTNFEDSIIVNGNDRYWLEELIYQAYIRAVNRVWEIIVEEEVTGEYFYEPMSYIRSTRIVLISKNGEETIIDIADLIRNKLPRSIYTATQMSIVRDAFSNKDLHDQVIDEVMSTIDDALDRARETNSHKR